MRKQEKKGNLIIKCIKEHIYNNLKQYMIVGILFLIGIVIGVMFVNYLEIETQNQVGNYITTFIECLKTNYEIDTIKLLKDVLQNHIIFTFLLWFMGCTIIGIPIVYGLVTFKGFSLGYTISSIIFTLGISKGILFSLVTLLLQNVLIIPCILALAVSGMKLYKAIIKNKKRENIRIEIIRHSIFSVFILLILIIASFIEVYISNSLLSICISYF